MKKYPVTEIFGPTVQGEGEHQGKPAYFIRFGGCDYRCEWCDTPHAVLPQAVRAAERLDAFEIVERLRSLPPGPGWVVITGGNPALHELGALVNALQEHNYKVSVETQGSRWKEWLRDCDSICVSPKPPSSGMEESLDLMWVYDNLLIPGSLALCDVEYHGAQLDRKFYEKTSKDLARRSKPILERLQKNTEKEDFNPNSQQQVKKHVYEVLGMPLAREGQHTARRGKLKEGPTAKAVLKHLVKAHPERDPNGIIADILQYRNLTKNAGTYVNGMLSRIDDDDRIRGNFLPHGTSTGRLSSNNPNLQNIPEASHTKIEVRNGFVAPQGYGLIAADYSQLELRIAAHCSDDDNFCQMFIEGRDPHQEVAFAFFQKPSDQVTPYERYMAKCVNFGVVYGRGAESIALGPEMEHVVEIGGKRWTTSEVKEFFDKFFGHFPDFFVWCEQQKQFAYKNQYIESPLGRKRRFPMIPRNDGGAVGRQAVNTPIQGTASDFTLSSLIRINKRFKTEKIPAHLILTIHDANYAECHLDAIDEAVEIMREEMEDKVPLESRVPFEVEIKVGHRWGDLEKVKDLPSALFVSED